MSIHCTSVRTATATLLSSIDDPPTLASMRQTLFNKTQANLGTDFHAIFSTVVDTKAVSVGKSTNKSTCRLTNTLWGILFRGTFTSLVEVSIRRYRKELLMVTKEMITITGANISNSNDPNVLLQAASRISRELNSSLGRLISDAKALANNDEDDDNGGTIERTMQNVGAELMGGIVTHVREMASEKDGSERLDSSLFIARVTFSLMNDLPILRSLLKGDGQAKANGSSGNGHTVSPPLASSTTLFSVDQLASAFDIADSDSDGILVGCEISEALESLSSSSASGVGELLAVVGTSSSGVGFNELVLLLSKWIHSDQGSGQQKVGDKFHDVVQSSLGGLFDNSVMRWINIKLFEERLREGIKSHVGRMVAFIGDDEQEFSKLFGAKEQHQEGLNDDDNQQSHVISPPLMRLLISTACTINSSFCPSDFFGSDKIISKVRRIVRNELCGLVVGEYGGLVGGLGVNEFAGSQGYLDLKFISSSLGGGSGCESEQQKAFASLYGRLEAAVDPISLEVSRASFEDAVGRSYKASALFLDVVFGSSKKKRKGGGGRSSSSICAAELVCINSTARFELFTLPVDVDDGAQAAKRKSDRARGEGRGGRDQQRGQQREQDGKGSAVGGLLKSFWGSS